MEERHCMRCGRELRPGSLTYVVQIRVVADFDGVLLDPEEGGQTTLEELIDQVQDMDPETLEKEIYEELTLVLCKSCRDRFVEETQHPCEGPCLFWKDPAGILH